MGWTQLAPPLPSKVSLLTANGDGQAAKMGMPGSCHPVGGRQRASWAASQPAHRASLPQRSYLPHGSPRAAARGLSAPGRTGTRTLGAPSDSPCHPSAACCRLRGRVLQLTAREVAAGCRHAVPRSRARRYLSLQHAACGVGTLRASQDFCRSAAEQRHGSRRWAYADADGSRRRHMAPACPLTRCCPSCELTRP